MIRPMGLVEFDLPDLREGYVDLVKTVMWFGDQVTVRGLPTRELTGVTMHVGDVLQPMLPLGIARGVNARLAAVEALALIAGVSRPELLLAASPSYASVLVDPTNVGHGAYGPRIGPQLRRVVRTLVDDPASRQAVMTVWQHNELLSTGDHPCTIALQFLIRDEQLEMHVTMRSQDVWRGVAYDLFMFTQLQLSVARLLRVRPGRYLHHITSLHIYESDVEAAGKLARPQGELTPQLPLGVVTSLDGTGENDCSLLQVVACTLLDGDSSFAANNTWYHNVISSIAPLPAISQEDES